MTVLAVDILGWSATGVFAASYLFSSPAALRTTQMLGAMLWVTYGALINAIPVIVANTVVFAAAAWTALWASPFRRRVEQ